MTPFESLLWNIWLPKVRTSINNDWSPDLPQQAVKLYEVWSSFLPPFIRDNLLDQLILPKVQKAVADWNPKNAKVSLQAIVFPWLPYIGLRLEDIVGDARRKVKNLLKSWVVEADILPDLAAWKDVRLLLFLNYEFTILIFFKNYHRFSIPRNGMLCSSNTLYRNLELHYETTSVSILEIKKWNHYNAFLAGQISFDPPHSPRF